MGCYNQLDEWSDFNEFEYLLYIFRIKVCTIYINISDGHRCVTHFVIHSISCWHCRCAHPMVTIAYVYIGIFQSTTILVKIPTADSVGLLVCMSHVLAVDVHVSYVWGALPFNATT